jgi:D-xylose 1-dehydrogenase (NADP+, D-xylono-1,5-lactone-forming)
MLRWGLLSTARINAALLPALAAARRSELVAVASRDPQRAAEYAREHGIARAFGSYEELLADPRVDVVYNPLPNSLHAEWTIRAAQAGKHVLCEKPLALSVAEVDAIAGAAGKAGVVVAEAFMYRHHAQTRRVRELAESGALGELRLVRGGFSFELTRPGDVRLFPELGGGCLWDVGCYPISLARLVAGAEPEQVFGWQRLGPTGVDMTFAGQLRFPGGLLAQIDSSFEAPFRTDLEVLGSKASLRVAHPYKPEASETLRLVRASGVEEITISAPGPLYLGEVQDLEAAVLDGARPAVSLEDSRGNVAAIAALLRSAREKLTVEL